MKAPFPLKILRVLGRLLVRGPHAEFVLGDLDEAFAREQIARGWAPASAGYLRVVVHSFLRHGTGTVLAGLSGDVRLALRQFRRQPRVYLTATAVLAVGLGVAGFAWGVDYGQYGRGLPIPEAGRVMELRLVDAESREVVSGLSLEDASALQVAHPEIESVVLWASLSVNLNDEAGPPERTSALRVSPSLLTLIRARPALGRIFDEDDTRAGAPATALLSHRLWSERFAASPTALGQTIRVDDMPHTIVGVLPEGTRFLGNDDLWLPYQTPEAGAHDRGYQAIGVIAAGATPESVQRVLTNWATGLAASGDPDWLGLDIHLARFGSFAETVNTSLTRRVLRVSGVLLLVMALANVANLFLVRSESRARELSVRRALGAGRLRVMRQLAAEAAIPCAIGLLGALWLAAAGLGWYADAAFIYSRSPGPIWVEYGLGLPHALLLSSLAVASTVVVAVLGGLFQLGRESGDRLRSRSISQKTALMGRALMGLQVAVGGTLLVLASVLLRSGINLRTADWGFETESVLTGEVALTGVEYESADDRVAFFRRLEGELTAIPGVQSATLATLLPMIRFRGMASIEIEGREFVDPESLPRHYADFVTPGFFRTFERPPLQGRSILESDVAGSQAVALVNQDFARRYFPDGALGRRVRIWADGEPGPWREVVGVAPHLWMDTDVNAHPEGLYAPLSQSSPRWTQFAIRVQGDPGDFVGPMREAVARVDPDLPVIDLRTMPELIRDRTRLYRFQSLPYVLIGLAAMLISIIGLYALVSFMAAQRLPEFGVRAALGASRNELILRAVSSAFLPVGLGLIGALVGGLWLVRGFDRMVFGSDPWDPLAISACFLLLIISAFASSILPASKASRVDVRSVLLGE